MKITEVAKKFDLSPDTLRYYEKEGLLPNVMKNKSGIREYSEEDLNWIEFIKCMRNAGLPVNVLKKYITLFFIGEETADERKNILIEQRIILKEKIETMKATLKRLDYKISIYENSTTRCEKKLSKNIN